VLPRSLQNRGGTRATCLHAAIFREEEGEHPEEEQKERSNRWNLTSRCVKERTKGSTQKLKNRGGVRSGRFKDQGGNGRRMPAKQRGGERKARREQPKFTIR